MATGASAHEAWRAVRGATDLQFAPVRAPAASPPPGWLERALEWLGRLLAPLGRAFGASWPAIEKALIAGGALLALFVAWRLLAPWWAERRRRAPKAAPEWTPDREEALALLEEADRLAEDGRYDAATHLLLRRSVAQIAAARPGALLPASTAREIAALTALPARARAAFAVIAARAERALFALRALDLGDWRAARAAYADFALADLAA